MSFEPSIVKMNVSAVNEYLSASLNNNVAIVPGGGSEWRKVLTRSFTELSDAMMPVGITELPKCLFQLNENLTDIDLTKIVSVGEKTFYSCGIINLNMPNLETIGTLSFSRNPVENIALPSVITIGELSFAECEDLKSVDFSSITTISTRAFYGCTNLDTVIFRNDSIVRCPGGSAFQNTKIGNGVGFFYVKDSVLNDYLNDQGWSTIYPDQIRSIEDNLL